jgi:hypothetical protein
VVPVGDFLPLRLEDALNVDNRQGCGCDRIVSSYLANAHQNCRNGARQQTYYMRLWIALIVTLFTRNQLSLRVRFYINTHLPLGQSTLPGRISWVQKPLFATTTASCTRSAYCLPKGRRRTIIVWISTAARYRV